MLRSTVYQPPAPRNGPVRQILDRRRARTNPMNLKIMKVSKQLKRNLKYKQWVVFLTEIRLTLNFVRPENEKYAVRVALEAFFYFQTSCNELTCFSRLA